MEEEGPNIRTRGEAFHLSVDMGHACFALQKCCSSNIMLSKHELYFTKAFQETSAILNALMFPYVFTLYGSTVADQAHVPLWGIGLQHVPPLNTPCT